MPSHLTRGVFRRLLSSRPLVCHRHAPAHPRTHLTGHHVRVVFQHHQRRTFLNLFQQKPKRDLAEPLLDPGMREMLTLERKIHRIVRLQPSTVLATAFNQFIRAKVDAGQPIEDFHAYRLLQTFRTICNDKRSPDGDLGSWWISASDLRLALTALATNPAEKLEDVHSGLAKDVYDRIPKEAYTDEQGQKVTKHDAEMKYLRDLMSVLCCTGETAAARDMLLQVLRRDDGVDPDKSNTAWPTVLMGFVKEDNEEEILRTLQNMEEQGAYVSYAAHSVLIKYYARKDRVEEMKKWFKPELFDAPRRHRQPPSARPELFQTLLESCLRTGQLEWANSVFAVIDRTWQHKAIILAAASTGKSVEQIDKMLDVLSKRDVKSHNGLDISVFNSLIAFAASKNDPYSAERYFNLTEKWGVEPNAQTYIQQVSYRLDAGDLTGAQASYDRLRNQPIVANEDWDVMNKMLTVLIKEPEVSREVIMGLVTDISARKKLFPASTISALAAYHLRHDEYFELVDLLQTYAYQYGIRDRRSMLNTLAGLALDKTQDTARIWDTYMIFHQVFDIETKRPLRQAIMKRMFKRNRPDLAVHIFTAMAAHVQSDARPDHDTYVAALAGIARTADADALEVVHNLLKLDTDVEPSTQLRTALMLAYTANQAPWRALEFWNEIATSDEGPSISSIHAALRACERSPFGERTARAIWHRLRASDVAVDEALFASYIGALAGNRQFDEVRALMPRMHELTGVQPSVFVLATLYNAAQGVAYQDAVAQWIAAEYPAVWAQLEAKGFDEDMQGFRWVKDLDRSIKP